MLAELIAFDLKEDYPEAQNRWGTYYGPMAVMQDESGQWFESPSIQAISASVLAYWQRRAAEASNPLLKLRYADLVWDFSRKVAGIGADISMARCVIDATVAFSGIGTHRYPSTVVEKLERALSIGLSIGDQERVDTLRDAIIVYEDRVAQDNLCGSWGFSFDLLLKQNKVKLAENQEQSIVTQLESRMNRLARKISGELDPHAVEAAALRLASYYRSRNQGADNRRVLAVYASAFEGAASVTTPMVGSVWLQKVYEVLRQHGLRDHADSIEVKMRDLSRQAAGQMQKYSASFQIPRADMDRYIEELTAGSLAEALDRIAVQFVPKRLAIEEQILDLAAEAPLQALLTRKIADQDGRTVATVGSVLDDMESHVFSQISQNLQFEAIFLRAALARLGERSGLTQESLLAYLLQSPIFSSANNTLVEAGLTAYFQLDHIAGCSILVPQVEAVMRRLLVGQQAPIYRPGKHGGLFLRQLDEILRDPVAESIFGPDIMLYFRAVLTDQRGWNLRNAVCHGFAPPEAFRQGVADRVLHLFLVFAQVRKRSIDEADEATAPPT
ncbi:MAG: DUF4209 domain-containing protein [Thermoanaerobaculia bacterium]|nr:DUF4209 domain-containing protein [Thermoanaerobaculia bacterium]